MNPPPADVARALDAAQDRIGTCAGRVFYAAVVLSTSDVALRLAAAGADDGTTMLADEQTAGRGRRGRRWVSPPGGLYFSVVLRDAASSPAPVTLTAGVAVAEAVRAAAGLPAEIEWPNDVVAPARPARGAVRRTAQRAAKLAGVLAEAPRLGAAAGPVVVGIGINVERVALPSGLARPASSLAAETGGPVDRAAVFVETLAALARWRGVLAAAGPAPVLARWRELAPMSRGAPVAWRAGGRRRQGVTAGIDADGALLVRCGGRVERLVAGEVTRLTASAPPAPGETDAAGD